MDSRELLNCLQRHIDLGMVTTYGNLSDWAYAHRRGAQAISSMLKAIVSRDIQNAVWTNRVVGSNGRIQNVNGQLDQLLRENVPIASDKVLMSQADVVQLERDD